MSLTWKTEIAKSIHFELYKKEGLSELTQLNLNANQLRSSKIEGSALKDAKSLKKFDRKNLEYGPQQPFEKRVSENW